MNFFLKILWQAIEISALVFLMMVIVDFIDVRTQGRLHKFIKDRRDRQYIGASFLGITPGCLGAYLNVSLYMHGFLSFGALVAGMVATSGDEAFVMLSLFPVQALLLFTILFLVAIPIGWLSDVFVKRFNIQTCSDCEIHEIHTHREERRRGHYLKEHLWKHIIRGHLWKIFLWTFFALLLVGMGLEYWSLDNYVEKHMALVLVLGALIGIIPESGPHLIFVTLFAQGVIPFSVLLASSIAQDGHGLLPLLAYSVKDSILIKLINVVAALLIGGAVYLMGF